MFKQNFEPMPSTFINRDKVVLRLVKERCKLAAQKSDKEQKRELIARNSLEKTNLSGEKCKDGSTLLDVYTLFPRRKDWCHIGKNRINLDSTKRNEQRLWFTYQRAKHQNCKEMWYEALCKYADDVVRIADECLTAINPPRVMVIEKKVHDKSKKDDKNEEVKKREQYVECRAVCIFPRTLKIIFSLLNKYLTRLFEPYFFGCSYAFRLPKPTDEYQMQHLNAISDIQKYRKQHIGVPLYVAECDMQKFYDTINHHTIKTRFSVLLQMAIRDGRITRDEAKLVKRWFFKYIDCYSFHTHVYVNNKKDTSDSFWERIKSRKKGLKCRINWLDNKKECCKYLKVKYLKRKNGYIGVPQGGALSGLIANIMMHDVDKAVLRVLKGKDAIYCRFCYDMILIGTEKDIVAQAFDTYYQAVKQSRLFPHSSDENDEKWKDFREGKRAKPYDKMKEFWGGKTRRPYEWGKKGTEVFPWITFVGFDINWMGNLRMRKSSFKKHIKKQNTVASEILLPYQKGKEPRYGKMSIQNTIYRKMIAMSVGRISLRNYQANKNIHSWLSAYSILDKNPWSETQLKRLDRHRNVVLMRASKKLESNKNTNSRRKFDAHEYQLERFTFKGCPFSYYGQCFDYKDR